ncbi:MAG: riboflavin synthase [Candidatus Omnitrophota bacterium]
MFTGIIEEIGIVENIKRIGNVVQVTIRAKKTVEDIKIGDSVSINGVCLTVTKINKDILSFDVMPETIKTTNLGLLHIKDKINLERALKLGDRVSGHFVTGHIDCLGLIRKKTYINNNLCFEIAIPSKFLKYILPKGSIALDGISLTIADRRSNTFSVYIIPHTLENTILKTKGSSDKVNLEFDILAKKA